MSNLNEIFRKVVPGIIDLSVDVIRHRRETQGVIEAEVIDFTPVFDVDGDIKQLEGDPFLEMARMYVDPSDLDLGYNPNTDTTTIEKVVDVTLSHVGQDEPRPPQAVKTPAYGGEAKSFAGQSDEDYCIECIVKHSQSAAMAFKEAIQRAEAGDPSLPGVQEKVRAAVRQITGIEEDVGNVSDTTISALDTMGRGIRKYIYTTGAEIGGASKEELYEAQYLIEELVKSSYLAREAQDGDCPHCRHAVGISMGLNVGKSLEMPEIDELRTLVKEERVDPVDAMTAIIGHAENINNEEAADYLKGVKKMMTTAL